jgi:hypothetical protein
MSAHTLGSDDHVQAITAAQAATREKYPMELNVRDFDTIVYALQHAANSGDLPAELADRALGMLDSIGETLGVEGI